MKVQSNMASTTTHSWKLPVMTGVLATLLYTLMTGFIVIGNHFAERVHSNWPLLVALALIRCLIFVSIIGNRCHNRSTVIAAALTRLSKFCGPLLALVVVIFVFGLADWWWQNDEGNFLSLGSARLIAVQSVMVAVAALGMTLIIISGGIDLAAGTALALCGTVLACMLKYHFPIGVALLAAVGCGIGCGLLNGLLVSLLRLIPFIITLGTMTIFLGIGKMIASSGGGKITPPVGSIPEWLETMVTQSPQPLWLWEPLLPNFAWGVWLALLFALAVAVLLHRTVFGRWVIAIGSNEATARLCGVPVGMVKVLVYTVAGMMIGIAGIYHFARLSVGDATAGLGLELKVIAAVVIGGGSLSGGRGSIIGTLCGAAIMSAIGHGCTSLGLENQVEDILLGVIIIGAVMVDRYRAQAY